MAAAALYALDNLGHLRDDHENVHKIANGRISLVNWKRGLYYPCKYRNLKWLNFFYSYFTAIREANNPNITVPPASDIHSNILLVYTNPEKLTADDLAHRLREVFIKLL